MVYNIKTRLKLGGSMRFKLGPFVCLISMMLLSTTGISAVNQRGDMLKNETNIKKTIIIKDLLIPVLKNGATVSFKPAEINWNTEEKIIPAPIIQRSLQIEWNSTEDIITIDKTEFRKRCVIPYINGLWTDPNALLRTPQMISQEAIDKLIIPSKAIATKGWPVFYPADQKFIADLIKKNNKSDTILDIKPLPKNKPTPESAEGEVLYNNLGLLYLPNSYVVPGGTFNEMYGWDSFFIICGMLKSAEYIIENPDSMIFTKGEYRKSNIEDVKALFDIAKGMVDNHIYEIFFYGGYILNANRSYYLTRSQPPLFTDEAILVYDFQKKYGKKLDLKYNETLAEYIKVDDSKFQTPTNFDEWMNKEVIPAAKVYYDYWTDPKLIYGDWNPFNSETKTDNPRVVKVTAGGNYIDTDSEESYIAYRFYTEGIDAAPEVVRSTQPQNKKLYTGAAAYFQNHPDENPINPKTGKRMFWDESSKYYANLTDYFYKSDRAIRCSGYDLSSRYGQEGQYAINYAPISLNTLLFKMGSDVKSLISDFGCYGLDDKAVSAYSKQLDLRIVNGKFVINNLMWNESNIEGYFSDLRIEKFGNAGLHVYKYGTMFYPLWQKNLVDSEDKKHKTIESALKKQKVTITETDSSHKKKSEEMIASFIDKGKIKELDNTIKNYGIPTSLVASGNQWDYPYAWAPVQYFAILGFNNLDPDKDETIKSIMDDSVNGWMDAIDIFFSRTGSIIEKYTSYDPAQDKRVSRGYSKAQIGFGWTNGVYMEALGFSK